MGHLSLKIVFFKLSQFLTNGSAAFTSGASAWLSRRVSDVVLCNLLFFCICRSWWKTWLTATKKLSRTQLQRILLQLMSPAADATTAAGPQGVSLKITEERYVFHRHVHAHFDCWWWTLVWSFLQVYERERDFRFSKVYFISRHLPKFLNTSNQFWYWISWVCWSWKDVVRIHKASQGK